MTSAEPNLLQALEYEAKGIPIGRPAEVNLRNNHAQYIFTWSVLFPSSLFHPWLVTTPILTCVRALGTASL
jgi:surfeit locus 1 family protein